MSSHPFPADPFGTGALRHAVLDAWRRSPTRFREDANAEEDLHFVGYRDRLLVELAQNAADAAAHAGRPGTLRLTTAPGAAGGIELRVANTGAPLDAAGVAALASLRASAKRDSGTVGRFGVGFASVLAVTDAPRMVSRTGGVQFSAERTRAEVTRIATLAEEVALRGGAVPVLRLVWPTDPEEPPPPEGFTTEVRLPLRPDVDVEVLLAGCVDQAADLLLALPWLGRVELHTDRGVTVWWREERPVDHVDGEAGEVTVHHTGPEGATVQRWLVRRAQGRLAEPELSGLATEARERPEWTVCWAVPLHVRPDPGVPDVPGGGGPVEPSRPDGAPEWVPAPLGEDVLHTPTPTDERLSLPARLLATLPVEPSRRRLLPGPATDAVLRAAAAVYPDLVRALPAEYRTALVPLPGFPLSEVDAALRELVLAELRTARWLPEAGAVDSGAGRDGLLAPRDAQVLDVPVPELVDLLTAGEVVPGLLPAVFSAPRHSTALAAVGVHRVGAAELAGVLAGVERPPAWWGRLYQALVPLLDQDPAAREELGALPVPLVDGRTVTGPRDVLLPETDSMVLDVLAEVGTTGLRITHPEAAHPLLERLGARRAGPAELLEALREAVERSVEDAEAGMDTGPLVTAVLSLADRAGLHPGELPWLAALALPDTEGEPCRADELVLPDSSLRHVLAADAPLGVLAPDVAGRWPRSLLTAVGVLDGFSVLVDEHPTAPDHALDGEEEWWEAHLQEHGAPPERLEAVRDLDLVAEDAWPEALRLLGADPDVRRMLREPGYTRWWLSHHARLAGHPPRYWRLPEADELTGLYEPVPESVLVALTTRPTEIDRLGVPLPSTGAGVTPVDRDLLVAAGVRDRLRVGTVEDAADLVARLGDPAREVPVGTVLRVHAALAEAVTTGVVDPAVVDPPERVRALDGRVVSADRAVVLDVPWLLAALTASAAVEIVGAGPAGSRREAESLAELLDLPLASDEVVGEVCPDVDHAEELAWTDLSAVVLACRLLGCPVPEDPLVVHERLVVRIDDDRVDVPWWVDGDGVLHAVDDPVGLSRALAWAAGRWADRHLLEDLLADPEGPSPHTLLG
ncbi:MAG TPA: ATP-binding protein [Pseudonocardiaceae bacterium]